MKKEELEFSKIRMQADRYRQQLDLIKHTISCIASVVAIWFIFDGVAKIISKQDPDGLTALAKVIESVHIGSILGYIFGLGATAAWGVERKGKKRAIKEKSKYQKIAEKGSPNRTGSGLDELGHTPKEDEDE